MELQETVKRRWVEGLRSGEYRQTTFELAVLRDGQPCHCVLGVLAVQNGWEPEYGNHIDGVTYTRNSDDGWNVLSELVDESESLSEFFRRNDDGMPFSELADYIEENVGVRP